MKTAELKRIIDAHFDDGVPLSTDLLATIACDHEAQRHYDRLRRLESELWDLPLEQPAPDLTAKLRDRLSTCATAANRPWPDLLGAFTVATIAAIAWPWLRPIGEQLYALCQGVVDWLPHQPAVTMPESLTAAVSALQEISLPNTLYPSWHVSPVLAGLLVLGGLIFLAVFNAVEAGRSGDLHGKGA